jgi:predicted metalloprotease
MVLAAMLAATFPAFAQDVTGIRRLLQDALGLIILSTMLGLLVVACGSETANKTGGKTNTVKPTAAQTIQAGGQEALSDLPKAPPAPRDAVDPRLRGSQEMTLEEFVQAGVSDADAMWQGMFEEAGGAYSSVDFYAYDQSVDACETTLDQTYSPLYCELDQTVYWPVDWVVPTSGKTLAEYGDFAVAVAAAHEVGHHVQNQLGILEAEDTGQLDTRSLQTELQADCFAGVWGYSAYYEGLVESGDLDEATSLLPDLGDVPEQPRGGPQAHGTPEERLQAFQTGYHYGDPGRCLEYTPLPEGTTVTASPEATTGG